MKQIIYILLFVFAGSTANGQFLSTITNKTAAGVTYATWSPTAKASNLVLSNGNLTFKNNGSWGVGIATVAMTTAEYYWEVYVDQLNASSGNIELVGMINYIPTAGNGDFIGQSTGNYGYRGSSWCISSNPSGTFTQLGSGCNNAVAGTIISFVYNGTAHTLKVYFNGVQVGSTITGVPAGNWYAAYGGTFITNDGGTLKANPASWVYPSTCLTCQALF